MIIKADGAVECGAREDYRGHVEVRGNTLLNVYAKSASIMLIWWSLAVAYTQ